jgi:methionine--tRNA ligase beta chain
MEKIAFSEWEKFQFVVGRIERVEEHPKADKLYVMEVDLGTEVRTLVAGLKKHYSKEDLVGKRVIVFANLEPAVIRGVRSEGMVLAAVNDDESSVILLAPEKDIELGSRVR